VIEAQEGKGVARMGRGDWVVVVGEAVERKRRVGVAEADLMQ
jgi:hypothetical protein